MGREFLTSITVDHGLVQSVAFDELAATDLPPLAGTGTVTEVATGTGLSGGPITSTGTIAIDSTGVVAGSYTNADITVNARGQITAAANGTGGSGGGARAAIYPEFTVQGIDDEFDNGSFSGFTMVGPGTNDPTIVEANDVLSLLHPGGDLSAVLHAWMKADTIAVGDWCEIAFRGQGRDQSFNICGVIMANGATYGAGTQVLFYYSPTESAFALASHTNYNVQGVLDPFSIQQRSPFGDMFLRLVYESANTWKGYASPDGISWVDVTGSLARTMTPTHMGFFITTWSGTRPYAWSLRYFRRNH